MSPDRLPLDTQGENYDHNHWAALPHAVWLSDVGVVLDLGIARDVDSALTVGDIHVEIAVEEAETPDSAIAARLFVASVGLEGAAMRDVDGRTVYRVETALDGSGSVAPGSYMRLRLSVVQGACAPDVAGQAFGSPIWLGVGPGQTALSGRALTNLKVQSMLPELDEGRLVVRVRAASAWGDADLIPNDGTELAVVGPGGPAELRPLQLDAVHPDLHPRFAGERIYGSTTPVVDGPEGIYVARLAVRNVAGTDAAAAEAAIRLPVGVAVECPADGGCASLVAGRTMPFIPVIAFVSLLVAIACRRRISGN